ncbi:putative tetratricopeptide-like helical domain superfamily [Dioscorea sansibarensis]
MQIFTWMESLSTFNISAADHATRLDLITKVQTVAEAEMYFEKIPDSASRKSACFPLLHSYVKERDLEKAETFMAKLQSLGLLVNPHLFNEMMKLYMATDHFEKVISVIQHMKRNKFPLNVLSYNLWMNACAKLSGVASVEMVYKEMVMDKNVEVGWSSYCTLANIYTTSGFYDKALSALRMAEQKLSMRNRLAYSFIMTNYSALNYRDGVLRLWESSKRVPGRITCVNYICVMLCFLKVGDIEEVEKIFRSWELECRKYDIRVSNVLLSAYVRNGRMDKAEALHHHTLVRGGVPNYKTWEILMEGWVKTKQMDKAVKAMKKGFCLLKFCVWRPAVEIVMAIMGYFEEEGSVEDAAEYVKVLRRLRLMTLPLYKSFIRVHIQAGRATPDICKMMERDKIEMDEESTALIECANKINSAEVPHI